MDDLRTPASTWRQGSLAVRHRIAAVVVASAIVLAGCTAGSGATTAPTAPPAPTPTLASTPTVAPTPTLASTPTVAPTVPPTPVSAYPLTLTDDEGNTVEIAQEPRRIVSLTPATTELLFALGAGDRLFGGTAFDDYPPEAVALPDVATFTSVDVEQIVALEADLVLAGGNSFNPPAALEQLRRVGVPVLVVYAATVDEVLGDLELVGTAIGRAEEAVALTATMRDEIDAVEAAVADLPRPRVFYELDATQEIFGPADDSFVAQMVELAGGAPITTGSPTVFSVALERLVEADPEVIVLGDAAYGVTPEQVVARPGWGTMAAVRTCAIRPVNDLLVTRPGPRLVEGLRLLALAIHPGAAIESPAANPSPSAAPSAAASAAPSPVPAGTC